MKLSSRTGPPSQAELEAITRLKTGAAAGIGWSPRLRMQFGYFGPDDWYEAMLFRLIDADTDWLDVGCGRDIFPSNPSGAAILAKSCRRLVGIDPSENIDENELLHERARCQLEEYQDDRKFDVISLRMVAEHILDPPQSVAALARLTAPGGRVVIYTVNKWSPASVVSAVTPMAVHHTAKRLLWRTEERDTFPAYYRMNTRGTLRALFEAAGFREETFCFLDDCRSLGRWKSTYTAELMLWRFLKTVGLHYPETCLLGVYRKGG